MLYSLIGLLLVKRCPAESIAEATSHLGGGVGSTVCHVLHQSAQVAVTDESRHTLLHVIKEAKRIAQEVCAAQDEDSLGKQLILIVFDNYAGQEGQGLKRMCLGKGIKLNGGVFEGDQAQSEFPLDVHKVSAQLGRLLHAQLNLGQAELEYSEIIPERRQL